MTESKPQEPTPQDLGFFSRIAHPGYFLEWSRYFIWPLVGITTILMAYGLYLAFFNSPADYQQGETVRIMYVHVPSAWLSQFCYAVMAIAAIGSLVWRHPLADVSAKAAAPLGATFTAIALITGALWGAPTWGTFWEWDGRMTSTLIMLFIYMGIIALWRTFEDQVRAGRIIAVITLVGAINVPIIKFSVDWWNTLHQPASVFRLDGPTMPPSILLPLFVMFFAFSFLFLLLHFISMRTEILRRRARAIERQYAQQLRTQKP
ncbi:heme exporter protein C [Maritalea mobilis]|uniref:Heme exporter protein C n=1 Tax=Maritalea mobilis TaxID=483324 RepID=A0A4R6VJ68_9HYPH|nr:heme ABC transporter permease [Maritalea mobilis]TDQ61752.1 heme exporter protein C [Maritalea mobilis]